MSQLIYAGIGSRKTPFEMLQTMVHLAEQLAERGWTLRSGGATGADEAFETGALNAGAPMEIYLPWPGFNGKQPNAELGYIQPHFSQELMDLARDHHPQWSACGRGARWLHCRNVCQVLGSDLQTPADMVVCWTPKALGTGGTGQALRIARAHNVPVFDIADLEQQARLIQFVQERET